VVTSPARTIIVSPTRYGAPIVPSHRVVCGRCGQPCWLSNRAAIDDSALLCVVCAMAVVAPGDILTPAPWVDDDLAAARELATDPSAEL
jgi:hypothetical protein